MFHCGLCTQIVTELMSWKSPGYKGISIALLTWAILLEESGTKAWTIRWRRHKVQLQCITPWETTDFPIAGFLSPGIMSVTCIFGNEDYRNDLVALTARTTHKAYNLLSVHMPWEPSEEDKKWAACCTNHMSGNIYLASHSLAFLEMGIFALLNMGN